MPSRTPSLPPLKVRQRQMRETAILDAARDLFAARGFGEVTLEDVVEAVGISKPTFYGHFLSKEELGTRVLRRSMDEASERLAAFEATLSPDQALRAMIEWAVDRHVGPAGERDYAGLGALFAQEEVRAAERELTRRLAALIVKAQRAGTVRTTAPAPLAAQTLNSILKDAAHDDLHRRGRLDLAAFKAGIATLLLGS